MLGAIAGDVIGSIYEHRPIKMTKFPLFHPLCRFTDDTVLTVALADHILHGDGFVGLMKQIRHADGGMKRQETIEVRPGEDVRLRIEFHRADLKARVGSGSREGVGSP